MSGGQTQEVGEQGQCIQPVASGYFVRIILPFIVSFDELRGKGQFYTHIAVRQFAILPGQCSGEGGDYGHPATLPDRYREEHC